MEPTWGPLGSCRPQRGPMSALATLLPGMVSFTNDLSLLFFWGFFFSDSIDCQSANWAQPENNSAQGNTYVPYGESVNRLFCFCLDSIRYPGILHVYNWYGAWWVDKVSKCNGTLPVPVHWVWCLITVNKKKWYNISPSFPINVAFLSFSVTILICVLNSKSFCI